MLTEFRAMWDDHLGRINVAKNQVELLEDTAKLIHPASFRAGPKTRGFDKVEIDNMFA